MYMILQKVPLLSVYALFFLVFLGNAGCQKPILDPNEQIFNAQDKIDGMTLVAPPKPFPSDPMQALVKEHVNWIAVIPYAYSRVGKTAVSFGLSSWQWWGEKPEGARETIKQGQKAGLQILLKPQVYVPGSWTGGIDFDNDEDWVAWEAEYTKYIMTYAKMAQELNVPLLCIGTEFKVSSISRSKYWVGLIKKIRTVYDGKLTYAANWDEYPHITWWDKLDYIGVDAYFPLSQSAIPSVEELVQAWQPISKELNTFSKKINRPVLFTEYGYMSVEGCAGRTWELEKNRAVLTYNEQAQANAFEALYQVFWPTSFWAGGFVWKWYPNEFSSPQRMKKDYTPQNKLGISTLSSWYSKE